MPSIPAFGSRLHPADLASLRSGLQADLSGVGNGPVMGNRPHHMRAIQGGYGRVPASALITGPAIVGAYNNGVGGFVIPCAVEDAMLYLNDDAGGVADILTVSVNGQTVTLAGSLPASTMRDDASLGGPVKGFYLGDVNSSTPVIITGTTKLTLTIFSFYLLGKYQGSAGRDIAIAEARGPNPGPIGYAVR